MGLFVAITIVLFWFIVFINNLFFSQLSFDVTNEAIVSQLLIVFIKVLLSAFLYTGLFITAHDAMHGTVIPGSKKINELIGKLCVSLYALFDYESLKDKHFKHHNHPVTLRDPDFCENNNFFVWYFDFMRTYLTTKQLLMMVLISQILLFVFNVSILSLLIFFLLPSILSTFQLFYFGTYLTHKVNGKTNLDKSLRARSLNLNSFMSFLCCYNFCYHIEHHAEPSIPWWKLKRNISY